MRARFQLSNVLVASIAASATIAVALLVPLAIHGAQNHVQRRANLPKPQPVSDEQQRGIVETLLRDRRRFFVQPLDATGKLLPMPEMGSVVLLDTSVVICNPNEPDKTASSTCSRHPSFFSVSAMEYDAQVPRKLRLELVAANSKAVQIPDPEIAQVIYRPRADVDALIRSDDGWDAFSATFAGAAGYVEYSRAVQSSDGRYALIYEARHCHGACFSGGEMHYFVRSGATWRLIKSLGMWVS